MSKILFKELLILFSILLMPFVFYLHKLVPADLQYIKFGSLIISGGLLTLIEFVWMINIKLLIIGLLIIWFITCEHWWRSIILIPLIVEVFKLIGLFSSSRFFDEVEYLNSLPITIPIMVVFFLILRKTHYFSRTKDLQREVNGEIEELFTELFSKVDRIKNVEKDFVQLKKDKIEISKSSYLRRLIEMRKQLYND